jgi:hypothetical protein
MNPHLFLPEPGQMPFPLPSMANKAGVYPSGVPLSVTLSLAHIHQTRMNIACIDKPNSSLMIKALKAIHYWLQR